MTSTRADGGKYLIFGAQLALLLLGILSYREVPRLYYAYLSAMGGIPTDGPFSDLHFVFAAFDCVRHGVDPYFNASCTPKHEYFNYAPALLWAARLSPSSGWTLPTGIVLDVLFFLSCLLLSDTRSRPEFWLRLVAAISSAVAYAAIAANIDIALFILAAVAATLLLRQGAVRFIAYVLIVAGAAVKLYPAALFGLALRERPRTMLAIAGTAIVAATVYLVAVLPQARAMTRHLPTGPYLMNWFGAVNLPYGITEILGTMGAPTSPALPLLFEALLIAATLVQIARLIVVSPLPSAFAALGGRDRVFLTAGSLVLVGCFFAWQNLGYRGIYLLFVLPGLGALATGRWRDGAWRVPTRTALFIAFLMWTECIRHTLFTFDQAIGAPTILRFVIEIGFWLLKEIVWWRVIAVLAALIVCFVRQSASYRAVSPDIASS